MSWSDEFDGNAVDPAKWDYRTDSKMWSTQLAANFTPAQVKCYFNGRLVQTVDATQFIHGDQNIWLSSMASDLGGTDAVDDRSLPAEAAFDYVRFLARVN